MRMDQLEAIVTISRCQSLHAASEQLHISVQALSASIKSLETELNLTVLERTSKGVSLTQDGLELVKIAKRFLADMYKLQNKQEDPRITMLNKPMTIYANAKLYELFIPRMICALQQYLPDIELNVVRSAWQRPLLQAVAEEEAEFAFVFYNTMDQNGYQYHPDLTFYPLFECRLVGLAHKDFPLSSLKTISFKSLLKYPLVICKMPEQQESDLFQMLNDYGEPKNVIFGSDMFMCREMVEAGRGIGFSVMTPLESYKKPVSKEIVTLMINDDNLCLYAGYVVKKGKKLSEENDLLLQYCRNFLMRIGNIYPSQIY